MPAPTATNSPSAAPSDLIVDLKEYLGIVRRGWRLIALSVLIGLTLAAVYLARTKRVYQATVRLLVLQQGGRPVSIAGNDPGRSLEGPDDYLATHSVVIRSPLVVGRAIDAVGLEDLPSLDPDDPARDPVQQAIRNLSVSRPDRLAKILRVDYQAGSRAEAVRMLQAVTLSYQHFLEQSYQRNNAEVITLVSKAKDELRKELVDLEGEYLEFQRDNPNLIADEKGRSFVARRLDQWDLEANEAQVKEVKLRAMLELGRRLADSGAGLWAILQAMNQVAGPSDGSL
ncbi:MAG TPA: Wzz/FepE/Etk N-terminal domain-containing protein, partial [Isosphaeraceae bacterium]